jgi:glucose-6-phosphate 1-epimerase
MEQGLVSGTNGLPKVVLRSSGGSTAEIYLHGATLTRWTSADGADLLFLSSKADFSPPRAIRGGVPVCWPQFGDMGPVEQQHGFARNSQFKVAELSGDSVTLTLADAKTDPEGGAHTPLEFSHPFRLAVKVSPTFTSSSSLL